MNGLQYLLLLVAFAGVTQCVQAAYTRGLNCINSVSGYYCDSVDSKGYFYMECKTPASLPKKTPGYSCNGNQKCMQSGNIVKCVDSYSKPPRPTRPASTGGQQTSGSLNCRDHPTGGFYCDSGNPRVYILQMCSKTAQPIKRYRFNCLGGKTCSQLTPTRTRCKQQRSGGGVPASKSAVRPTPSPSNGNAPDCSSSRPGYYCDSPNKPARGFVRLVCDGAPAKYNYKCRDGEACVQFTDTVTHCKQEKDFVAHKKTPGNKPGSSLPTKAPSTNSKIRIARGKRPMFVYFSVDDSVTPDTFKWSMKLFKNRKNPNNCRVTATYNVIQNDTQWDLLKIMHNKYGYEINSHSRYHKPPTSWWRTASKEQLEKEIVGLTKKVEEKTGISRSNIKGYRAPFLEVSGDRVFQLLVDNGFRYDTTLVQGKTMRWPFRITKIKPRSDKCMNVHGCPTKSFNLWEVPLNTFYGCPLPGFESAGYPMLDQCPTTSHGDALKYLRYNFYRHYNSKEKVPFGLNMHFAWFAGPHRKHNLNAMVDFLDEIQQLPDVWIVSAYKIVQWMENQVTHENMKNGNFRPVQC